MVLRHATVSTVPRVQGQGRPPGQATGGQQHDRGQRELASNLTDDPEVRYTEGGIARAVFRVAVSGRREQEPSFFTVIVRRDQAEHASQSLSKGSRVVVVSRLQQRSWTAKDGSAQSVSRSWPRSWGRACGGRRRPRPGPRGARTASQLDQRCDGAGESERGDGSERPRPKPASGVYIDW